MDFPIINESTSKFVGNVTRLGAAPMALTNDTFSNVMDQNVFNSMTTKTQDYVIVKTF